MTTYAHNRVILLSSAQGIADPVSVKRRGQCKGSGNLWVYVTMNFRITLMCRETFIYNKWFDLMHWILFQVLTNALYKSVPHRAVVNRTQTRISLAYFFAPRTGLEIVPSPELVDRTTQSRNYKPFTIEEYLAVKKGQLLNTLEHFSLQPLLQLLSLPFENPTPVLESA